MKTLTDIVLSDRAFIGLTLSAVEVYKNECLGALLGYNTPSRIIAEYAIPYQTAERKPTEVAFNRRTIRVHELLPQLSMLKHVGFFHSHTQWGDNKASPEYSKQDSETMISGFIDLIIAVNDSGRKVPWSLSKGELRGSIGQFHIRIAGYYKTRNEEIRQYPVLCPYAVGFEKTSESQLW